VQQDFHNSKTFNQYFYSTNQFLQLSVRLHFHNKNYRKSICQWYENCLIVEPPSEVRNLKVQTLNADTVTISWQPPSSLSGRSDLYYTVRCERCSASVTYSPSRTQLTETSVTLSSLVPKTSYSVQIVAENGVYQVATPASTAPEVSFVTLESGSTPLAVPRKVGYL